MVLEKIAMEDGQRRFSLQIIGVPGRKDQTQEQNKCLNLCSRNLSGIEKKLTILKWSIMLSRTLKCLLFYPTYKLLS